MPLVSVIVLIFAEQNLFGGCFNKTKRKMKKKKKKRERENFGATIRGLGVLKSRLDLIKIKVHTHLCSSNLVL